MACEREELALAAVGGRGRFLLPLANVSRSCSAEAGWERAGRGLVSAHPVRRHRDSPPPRHPAARGRVCCHADGPPVSSHPPVPRTRVRLQNWRRRSIAQTLAHFYTHFYTRLVEGETRDHDSFLVILPDGQSALGLQQVVDLFIVHLRQGTSRKAEVCFPSRERSFVPQGHTQAGVPPSSAPWCAESS